ncbi:MAG: LysR family transcriptional regulator [Candidatus Limivicinus sp.]|nr:LysR family transcriptional regulator [Candidatus Limivicinus sp.]
MDSKKVNALLTAIDKGSLTAAAAELGYTQSGLTHMMNSMEDELGLSLLIRSKSGVHLSPAGQALLPVLRNFVYAANDLEKEADRLRLRNFSTLHLGSFSSIARHWIPEILSRFKLLCPDTQISLTVNDMDEMCTAVKNEELDCAMVSYQPDICQGLSWIPLWKDELMAIIPASSTFDGDAFPVEGFDGADFLMPSLGFELDILPIFTANGRKVSPNILRTNLDDASIASMVEHGLGVSVLSDLVTKDMSFNIRTLPLEPSCYRSLGIVIGPRCANDRNIRRLVACSKDVVSQKYGTDLT